MLAFVTGSQNLPFTVSLAVMFGIAILEGVTTVFGAALSGLVETVMPELDVDVDMHVETDHSPHGLSKILGWMHVGKVPILMLLVIFLTAFGLLGYAVQSMALRTGGMLLPAWLASIAAMLLAIPMVKVFGGVLEKIMPKDETEAVSPDSFIGRVAVIVLGVALVDKPAQAKVKDMHGLFHYILVEPDKEGLSLNQGESVLLVRKEGNIFFAIENTHAVLLDQ